MISFIFFFNRSRASRCLNHEFTLFVLGLGVGMLFPAISLDLGFWLRVGGLDHQGYFFPLSCMSIFICSYWDKRRTGSYISISILIHLLYHRMVLNNHLSMKVAPITFFQRRPPPGTHRTAFPGLALPTSEHQHCFPFSFLALFSLNHSESVSRLFLRFPP